MVELIGAPFDLCGGRPGSRLGPAALRLAGLKRSIVELGIQVEDRGDVTPPLPDDGGLSALRHAAEASVASAAVKAATSECLGRGMLPIVLGGDHSVSIGSISAALDRWGSDLAVLWVDAHADINTPEVSPSGNLHGMPVAALMGKSSGTSGPVDDDWEKLLLDGGSPTKLGPQNLGYFGLRSVDPAEQVQIGPDGGMFVSTMQDIDRYGVEHVLKGVRTWLQQSGATQLWISFDVDVLDPVLAPGTGSAVRGGLTYREAHLCGEMLHDMLQEASCPFSLAGVDLVETNPLFDTNNETAKMVVEWVASLFGKTILGNSRSTAL